MAEKLLQTLRSLQPRLLRCTISSDDPLSSSAASDSATFLLFLIHNVVQSIESRCHFPVLSSDAVKAVFDFNLFSKFTVSVESAQFFYSELVPDRVEWFINSEGDETERCYRMFLVLAVAVAALLAFSQCNITGHHFESAQVASKLDFSESGALRFRTVNQVEPTVHLHLITGNSDADASSSPVSHGTQGDNSRIDDSSFLQHPLETIATSDVLMAPRILKDNRTSKSSDQAARNCSISSIQLKPIQQAVILARFLAIKKGSQTDELQLHNMGTYIEAIDSQQLSHFIIRLQLNCILHFIFHSIWLLSHEFN